MCDLKLFKEAAVQDLLVGSKLVFSHSSQNSIADDDGSHDNAPIDLSHLQLSNMEDFDMGGQDLSSWLNLENDGLLDNASDLMGLAAPMDELADLNMF
ncbi:hypothetical protein SUGI_1193810 [Cryptomeria japonica]|nr:hypothetical protein SUGI_1193810 [Cryptomeria japonica]